MMGKTLQIDSVWLDRIAHSLDGISFGSVQIIVHDGKIVQLEKTERRRYEAESKSRPAAVQDHSIKRVF